MKQLTTKQNMLWNSIGCLIYQACQWGITVAVVLFSSDYENSGYLAYAMAIGNIFNPLATYNMRTIQVSDVEDEISPNVYIGFRIVTVCLAFLLMLGYLCLTASSIALVVVSLCWLVFKADEAFCSVYYAMDQKGKRMDYIGISQGVRGALSIAAFSCILFVLNDIYLAILSMSAACIAVTVFYDCRKARLFSSVNPVITFRSALFLGKTYFPAVVTLVCYGAVVSVARQVFEGEYGAEALGIYAAVATPTVLVQVAATYLYNPLLTGISKHWIKKDIRAFAKSVGSVALAIVIVSCAAFVVAGMVGESTLVFIFGETIREYAYLLIPALAATAATTLFAFFFDILICMRCFSGALAGNLSALACAVVLSGFLVKIYYMNGINVAILLSFSIGIIIELIFLVRKIRMLR